MNKAKKIFAGMLAGVMALSFAACSGGKTADETDTTAAPAQAKPRYLPVVLFF